MKKFKKYKNDLGISLLEVIFALGVMASLTPLVVKFAFKDLSDIKYLNLAKKVKTLTKSIVAYSAKTSGSWQNDSNGTITAENLDSLHLGENVVDKEMLDNSYIKYIKSVNGGVNVYATIDMNNYSLTPDKFKQTLLYVENNIGYVVDDVCGSCAKAPCVCSINNDWAIEYNAIASQDIQKVDNKFFAVVKVDDNLLKKDYLKDFYLYRNSQGGDSGNVMQRDLSLGGFDLKDIVTIFTQSLFGKNTATELINLKVVEGKLFNNVNVATSIVLAKGLVMNFLTDSIVEATNIYFQQPVVFQKFSAPSAILIKDEKSLKNQTIKANNVIFDSAASNYSMQLDSITVNNEMQGMDRTEINGDLAVINAPHIQMDAGTVKTKIFNVNNQLKIGENGAIVIDAVSGQIQMDAGSLIINNIKGSSDQFNYVDRIKTTKTLFDNLKSEIQTKFAP